MSRKKVNKAQAIREMLKELPDARNKDIIAALKKKRIIVSAAQVSNLRLGGADSRRKNTKGKLDLNALLGAKAFVEHTGGIEKARVVLDALAKLK